VGYVKAVDHPNFRCLFDSYHFWIEDEPIDHVQAAMEFVRHVHLADKQGRVAPGESGQADYRPLFRVLRDGGYDGLLTVEATLKDLRVNGPRVVKFIKDQWNNC
jgi:sugar phosphate isomerase/epimerase